MALGKVPHDLRETMFRALVVIGFFPEPLNLESVAEAVVMDPMRSMTFDSNWRLLDPAKSLLDYLGSFISVAKVWNADAWSAAAPASPSAASISTMASSTGSVLNEATAELAHSSVKEFVSARWDRIAAESHSVEVEPTVTPTDHVHGCCVVYLAHLLRQDCAAFTRNAFDEQFPFAYFAQLVTLDGILRHAPSPPMRRRLAPLGRYLRLVPHAGPLGPPAPRQVLHPLRGRG